MSDKMFAGFRTWNPVKGCNHGCPYCWAIHRMLPRVRHQPKYADGFAVQWFPKLIEKGPPKADRLFVVDMGDLFCTGFPEEVIAYVLNQCLVSDKVKEYLLLTKNPGRYVTLKDTYPNLFRQINEDGRFLFGATIETNFSHIDNHNPVGKALGPGAPSPYSRYVAMMLIKAAGFRTFISIEPVLQFDIKEFGLWLTQISPEVLYIGYDNYRLVPFDTEPPLWKVNALIDGLRKRGLDVRTKKLREGRIASARKVDTGVRL